MTVIENKQQSKNMNITKDTDGFVIRLSDDQTLDMRWHLQNVSDYYELMAERTMYDEAHADRLRAKAEQARTWAKEIAALYNSSNKRIAKEG